MTMLGAIATNRFGLGAKPGEIATASADPHNWLKAQLDSAVAGSLTSSDLQSSRKVLKAYVTFWQEKRDARLMSMAAPESDFPEFGRRIIRTEVEARIRSGIETDTPFYERLVRFWSNHFTVSSRSLQVAYIAGAYEREAIRPNVTKRFEDLVIAAVFHPAMLLYLDNYRSIGPNSKLGQRRRRLGLNENLAREVMELHTLTPASGYSQEDVTEFARALTGWTIGGLRHSPSRTGQVGFWEELHEPGSRRVLGQNYPEQGEDQAIQILRDFCAHPATARNVALKLARHIVSDTPPAGLIDRLERVYLNTNGDLSALYVSLTDSPEAWSREAQKFKTPDELITSTARLLGQKRGFLRNWTRAFEGFGQQPLRAPSPEGWPDTKEAWLGPNAILKRVEWADRIAARTQNVDARALLQQGVGPMLSPETLLGVAAAESGQQAMTVALMSPEFQRR